ncbi:MAG: fibrobacter succinogenes major paralogous domain-containing protein [Tannerellaceae bacterium]|jgi:uncharacterized protein (TIGR02145 family)|nr:fibrobacter succinogenes major paralogous domain-containing protein [Tannerellaceae bacterium]
MKKACIVLTVLLCSLSLFAQTTDVVYLKNGSIIKARILEYKPGESVKIEIYDGSIFVYPVDEVQKIEKDPNAKPAGTEQSHFDGELLTDVEGNTYRTVVIKGKVWMAENLKTRHYADGTPIERINNGPNYYYVDAGYIEKYGILYNWAATVRVLDNKTTFTFTGNRQGVCPNGWHVPTMEEYAEAVDGAFKNKDDCEATWRKFKSETGWPAGENGYNSSGFSAIPAGGTGVQGLGGAGKIIHIGLHAYFWTATTYGKSAGFGDISAYSFSTLRSVVLGKAMSGILHPADMKRWGKSVRCVKD